MWLILNNIDIKFILFSCHDKYLLPMSMLVVEVESYVK